MLAYWIHKAVAKDLLLSAPEQAREVPPPEIWHYHLLSD